MKDRDQKRRVLQYCVSKRWLPQLEVDVHTPRPVARKTALMTDLDVFASVPDDFVGFRTIVFDCKTLARESAVNRALWLNGILSRMDADYGVSILKKSLIEVDHKLVAARLRLVLLAENEFDVYASAMSPAYSETVSHIQDLDSWQRLMSLKERFPALVKPIEYWKSVYWMQSDNGEACRKTIATLQEARSELDPVRPEHVALVAEYSVLLARTLAMLVAYLFRAYLHPRDQSQLEEAAKVLLYGGRDAYEHRNQLYRLLKERSGVNFGAGDLALPEWGRFVQLLRQLLDAPPAASRAPLILREVAFAHLNGGSDFEFARKLCEESPQAGRFAVLILSYLAKASRIPPDFTDQLEHSLLALLQR